MPRHVVQQRRAVALWCIRYEVILELGSPMDVRRLMTGTIGLELIAEAEQVPSCDVVRLSSL